MPRWDRERSQRLAPIPGNPPSLINVPPGCPFHPRCHYVQPQSSTTRPELRPAGSAGHLVACHLPDAQRAQIFHDDIRPRL
jgi:peptide/nickel transport system ATP-binding protein